MKHIVTREFKIGGRQMLWASLDSVLAAIYAAIEVLGPKDVEFNHIDEEAVKGIASSSIKISAERAWGAQVAIRVKWKQGESHLDGDLELVTFVPSVELDWSTTTRTVSQATTALVLFDQMVNLAALIEGRLTEYEVIGYIKEPPATA